MKEDGKYWDRASKNYDKNDKIDGNYLKMMEITRKFVDGNDVVMDLGCATGSISIDISDFAGEVLGLDISSRMIEIARKKPEKYKKKNIRFQRSTIFDEGFKENSFDAIIAFNILHLMDNTDKVMSRVNELLKPGGVLVSSTPCLGDKGNLTTSVIKLITKTRF